MHRYLVKYIIYSTGIGNIEPTITNCIIYIKIYVVHVQLYHHVLLLHYLFITHNTNIWLFNIVSGGIQQILAQLLIQCIQQVFGGIGY